MIPDITVQRLRRLRAEGVLFTQDQQHDGRVRQHDPQLPESAR